MSMFDTAVPNIVISETGIETPQTEEILQGVLADFNKAFGGNLNIENVASPQYVLASEIAQAITLQNAGMAYTLAQFDPNTAVGRFQDAIGRIYFIERMAGTSTIVEATVTGIPYYSFDAGTMQAQDEAGNIYVNVDPVTITALGTVKAEFKNIEVGAIPCPAGSLNQIYVTMDGWDAITNESAGDLGSDIESRQDFEARRFAVVAKNGQSSLAALYGAIRSIDGVTDCYVAENDTNDVIYIGETNVQLKPHSIYVCVVGGSSEDIGLAILQNKTVGADTNGNTSVSVLDPILGDTALPYTYNFNRPTLVPVFFRVEISQSEYLPTGIDALVKTAIIQQFDTDLASDKLGIGDTVYASRFVGAVTSVDEYIDVIDVSVGTVVGTYENLVNLGVDQMPTIEESNITIVIT